MVSSPLRAATHDPAHESVLYDSKLEAVQRTLARPGREGVARCFKIKRHCSRMDYPMYSEDIPICFVAPKERACENAGGYRIKLLHMGCSLLVANALQVLVSYTKSSRLFDSYYLRLALCTQGWIGGCVVVDFLAISNIQSLG